MTEFVLLETGSRDWTDADLLRQTLDIVAQAAADNGFTSLLLRHGACYPRPDPRTGKRPNRSADWLAHLWATLLPHPLTVFEDPMPARWGVYKRRAGFKRNFEMAKQGADLCVAFILNGSAGATGCADLAEFTFNIETRRVCRGSAAPMPDEVA
jgi:hypothetical protein